ncbi:MAG: MFS transporter [Planctomycetaceae bacterium]|nr:MFS transporter [Planctomycetaceae bacterium]
MNPSELPVGTESEPTAGEPAEPDRPAPDNSSGTIYNHVFWLAYAANVSLVMANALTFRFAEFISWLGGTEETAGTIVSVGIIGALTVRLVLGQAIDNYGTRRLWMIGGAIYIASTSLFLVIGDLGWPIYLARLGFASGIATMFTCSMVHIQNLVPANRRTEIIGNLGSSGFVGMILGSQLGDWIFRSTPPGQFRFSVLFGGTVVLGLVYVALVITLTRGDVHKRAQKTPAVHRLILNYWPGNVVLVAIMMGISITVTTIFLTRYATSLGLVNGVGTFFTGYAMMAFLFRVQTATWSRTIGRHRMIWLGLAGHCLGHGFLPFVTEEWHFLIPAVACGIGHALLFPAVVSLGAGAFPKEYRGSGTTITLGFIELGAAVSAPILGWVIDQGGGLGFTQMFWVSSAIALTVGIYYAIANPSVDVETEVPSPYSDPQKVETPSPISCRLKPCLQTSQGETVSKPRQG